MKQLIHSLTSTVPPLKLWTGKLFNPTRHGSNFLTTNLHSLTTIRRYISDISDYRFYLTIFDVLQSSI